MPANMVLMNHDDGFIGRGRTATLEGLLDKWTNCRVTPYLSGLILVIFEPCRPIPAINPFWPKMNA